MRGSSSLYTLFSTIQEKYFITIIVVSKIQHNESSSQLSINIERLI